MNSREETPNWKTLLARVINIILCIYIIKGWAVDTLCFIYLLVDFFLFDLFLLGEFADVYKGTLKTREGKQVVAVKVLRVSLSFSYLLFQSN